MEDFLEQTPPDDTGSTTLERFRYQAQIAVPFCIDCVFKRDVVSVIMEHFEDIVVEYSDSWHFIQVKTRDAHRGPWPLSDVWHGIKSLYRSYEKTSYMPARYSLFLEGATKPKRPKEKHDIETLKKDGIKPSSIIEEGAKQLKISAEECETFFSVFSIHSNQVSRSAITDRNIGLLGEKAPGRSTQELRSCEKDLADELLKAMYADRLGEDLYTYMSNTSSVEEKLIARVQAKRLDSEAIRKILGSIAHGASPLLKKQTISSTSTSKSKLEQKLIAGGASDRIIKQAKSRRADATLREIEILSSGLFGDDKRIEDIQERLVTFASALVEQHDYREKPAKIIWGELLKELQAQKDLVDPNRLYAQDAFLLLGAVCELSDQCRIDWGVPLA